MNLLLLISGIVLFIACGWAAAKTHLSQPQALEQVFPGSRVERKTLFLTPVQIRQIESLSRVQMNSAIITYYVSRRSSGVEGIAFFDRRVVRTLPVTYMAVVQPSGAIDRVEVLSFDEPEDYVPPPRWLKLYRHRLLNNDLAIGRDIPRITGASLTSQTMNDGIRLILAIYQVGVKGTL